MKAKMALVGLAVAMAGVGLAAAAYVAADRREADRLARLEAEHEAALAARAAALEARAARPPYLQPGLPGDAWEDYRPALAAAVTVDRRTADAITFLAHGEDYRGAPVPFDASAARAALEPVRVYLAHVEDGLRRERCAVPENLEAGLGRQAVSRDTTRIVGDATVLDGRLALAEGRARDGARRFLEAVFFGQDIGRRGTVLDHEGGLLRSRWGLEAVRQAIASGALDGAALAEVEAGLARAAAERRPVRDAIEAEWLALSSTLLALARQWSVVPLPRQNWLGRGEMLRRVEGGAGQRQALAAAAEAGDGEWPRRVKALQGEIAGLGEDWSTAPCYVVEVDAQALALLRGVRLQAALARAKGVSGSYPDALEALGPAYAGAPATDPYTGRPFVYRPAERLLSAAGTEGEITFRLPK